MKKIGKLLSIILIAALAVSIFTVPDLPVKASTITNPEVISANNTWRSGNIVDKEVADFYRITIPSDGWLTVEYQALSLQDSYWQLWNNDCTKSYGNSRSIYGSSTQNPKTDTCTWALEQGSYLVKVESNPYCKQLGTYRLRASFKAANNNDTVGNDEFVTAQKLSWNKLVTGFFTYDNRVDFYQMNLSRKTTIRLICTSYTGHIVLTVYDKDYRPVHTKHIYNGAEGNPETYQYEQELGAGTYYFKFAPYDWGTITGRYSVKLIQKVMAKSISISANKKNGKVIAGQTVKLTATVKPSNTTDKTVEWTSADPYIASINKTTGKITTYRAGKVYLKATSLDGSSVSKSYKLIIKPKKSKRPYVSSSSKGRLYVSYGSQAGVKGYEIQYATNSKFKNAKIKKTTRTYYTLKGLKSKKKYYVRVRSFIKDGSKYYRSSWSSAKSYKTR